MAPASISLLNHHLPVITTPHEQQQEGGRDEKYNVHDAEGEGGLQHGTCLIHIEREWVVEAGPA